MELIIRGAMPEDAVIFTDCVMLDFEINELKRFGCKEIFLWVFEENYKARRFYEKHGFRFSGTTREKTYGISLVQCEYVLENQIENG